MTASNPGVDIFLVDLACVTAWLLALVPAGLYLGTGWDARRQRLLGVLKPESLKLYYQQFRRSEKAEGDLQKRFKAQYGKDYGRRHYICPLIILGLVTGVGMWATARALLVWLALVGDKAFPPTAISAFLGAFAWVIADQLSRLRSQDFTPHDVYGCALRILIAVPVGYALAPFGESGTTVSLAFLLGVFPTGTLQIMIRRLAAKQLGIADGEPEDSKAVTELADLQGVGRAHAERFEEEGINTIVELAWADPIDLSNRTNFDVWFVVDCVSQAILWVYLGNKVREVYRFSLRGSMEAQYLLEDLASDEKDRSANARQALEEAADTLKMKPASLQQTLCEVARDPYTIFLCAIWDEKVDEGEPRSRQAPAA